MMRLIDMRVNGYFKRHGKIYLKCNDGYPNTGCVQLPTRDYYEFPSMEEVIAVEPNFKEKSEVSLAYIDDGTKFV